MPTPARYTVTAALPYANGPLHIGHLAGAYLPADIYVRYLRLRERDVVFVCGSDEHGAAITMRAKQENSTPQEIVDRYHGINKEAFASFGIDFDIYHRTSEAVHHQTSQEFFKTLHEAGKFVQKTSKQYFDPEAEQFLADRYIMGTCPKCGHDSAYGDQCENCGTSLSPSELINPRSTISGATPITKTTTHWYLPMDEYEGWLKDWIITEKKDTWKTNVYGQCRSWIEQGLQPRAMTRDLDWGVPVPLDEAKGKVLYVWLDAPIGYISATKAWAEEQGKSWETYWKDEDTKLVHFIGKDNIVFHCIIFPIILKAHGDYVLPDNVPANEFLNLEGAKLSTSRNWAVWLHEFIQDFPGQNDVLRYVLTSIAPETKDSEFTWKDFQDRNNNELVANLGNFVNRTLQLSHKYLSGVVPTVKTEDFTEVDQSVFEETKKIASEIEELLENYRFRDAQNRMMDVSRLGNKYFTDTEPWKLQKTEPERVKVILYTTLQLTASLATLMKPFLPDASEKLERLLNVESKNLVWENVGTENFLSGGQEINKPELLFQKIDDSVIQAQVEKLEATKLSNKAPDPIKETVSFNDFTKLDIRVATILEAKKVKKAKKLLEIRLDTGVDERTVVSGIAEYYKPEDIIGRQVCLLANLAPRKIRGVESEGMILMAEDKDGTLRFVEPSSKVSEGVTVR
ncbi:MAG: methionine--tRNA ligase [Bacteroidota bacterium]